jgi:hypothetical protein
MNALQAFAIAARNTDETVPKNASTSRRCPLWYTARPTAANNTESCHSICSVA